MRTVRIAEVNVSAIFKDGQLQRTSSADFETASQKFDTAMRKHGAIYLTGTGISSQLSIIRDEAAKFFASSKSAKQEYEHIGKYGSEGYTAPGGETISRSLSGILGEHDPLESLVFLSDSSEKCPPRLRAPITAYMRIARGLHDLLTALMERALSAPIARTAFEGPNVAFKLSNYPVSAVTNGYGAHTDFTGFTLLSQDENEAFPAQGGLEMRLDDGEWALVPPLKDSLVVNAGDLVELISNGLYKSPVHRVMLASPRDTPRLSVIYFTSPSDEKLIEPSKACCTQDNPTRYRPVLAGDWFRRKLDLTGA